MPVFECTSRVTRRSLMNQTKDELATRVLELMEEIGTVRDRMAKVEADRLDEGLRRSGRERSEAAAAERYEELRAAAKAALGEIPCGPEWLERLRSAVAGARVKDTEAAARGRMDGLAERCFERVCRERDEAVAGAREAEARAAIPEPADAFGAHIEAGTLGRIGDREIGPGHVVLSEARYRWLFHRAGLPVDNLPIAVQRAPDLAPFEAEMEAALAPLFAPVPVRDSDLPAVVSPCA
ncbi:hypothetical protein [Methylobacterium sp. WL19]|uniref:hypothetical protein n=1 Tax=Methylobacterium sp. WL19 TaxID=2603896 RepID=UPI0011C8F6E1|nr:hypothetical protein [Methylobacterium sp. WL19]TXN21799.1 hypothetical protein FV220_22695 [Methylobacterium sp. WL19]